MTTAHRPTWNSAIASGNKPVVGNVGFVAARDLPQNLSLKRRHDLTGDKPAPPKDTLAKKAVAHQKREPQPQLSRDADIDLASSEDESEDDEAEVLRELARIKQERAEEAARRRAEEEQNEEEERQQESLVGNPLLNSSSTAGVKRRWDDDVVFRNQSRGVDDPKRRFINDTIRSDFHRRFLNRYFK
eukprot:Hpha_TRINITY_DN17677_c0_g1::TRINITY_DN17677_c0_g1_i1::g.158827::m.158827/K12863/CWC15; protein CWC15